MWRRRAEGGIIEIRERKASQPGGSATVRWRLYAPDVAVIAPDLLALDEHDDDDREDHWREESERYGPRDHQCIDCKTRSNRRAIGAARAKPSAPQLGRAAETGRDPSDADPQPSRSPSAPTRHLRGSGGS